MMHAVLTPFVTLDTRSALFSKCWYKSDYQGRIQHSSENKRKSKKLMRYFKLYYLACCCRGAMLYDRKVCDTFILKQIILDFVTLLLAFNYITDARLSVERLHLIENIKTGNKQSFM